MTVSSDLQSLRFYEVFNNWEIYISTACLDVCLKTGLSITLIMGVVKYLILVEEMTMVEAIPQAVTCLPFIQGLTLYF